jgi:hypothetical protein
VARATADIGAIDVGGVVKLTGLHWEVVHRSGSEQGGTATFTICGISVGGVPVPIPPADTAAAFTAANQLLGALGIELRAPKINQSETGISIDPVAIAVVPNAARDGLAGQLLGAALPVRQAVTDALLQQSCKNGTYITIADIAVGSITGAGSFSLELGGVQAATGDLVLSNFLQQPPSLGAPDTGLSDVLSSNSIADLPGTAGTPAIPGTPGQAKPTTRRVAPIASTTTAKNSRLAAVAGATLLLLAAVAELDRRKMRRAQTQITTNPEA